MDIIITVLLGFVLLSACVAILLQCEVRGKGEWNKLGMVFAVSALIALYSGIREGFNFDDMAGVFFFSFLLSFAVLFKDRIFVKINEAHLLFWNLLFGYMILLRFPDLTEYPVPMVLLVDIFLVVMFVNLTPFVLHFALKLFLSIWYILMTGFILIQHVGSSPIFWDVTPMLTPDFLLDHFLEVLFFFVSAFYLMAYYVHLVQLVPLPGKRESFQDMKKRVRDQSRFFVSLYEDHQSTPWKVLLFVLFLGSLMYGNYSYGWLEQSFFISILIIFGPFLSRFIISSRSI